MGALSTLFGSGSNDDSTSPFDRIRHEDDQGEFWCARELADVLGYGRFADFRPTYNRTVKNMLVNGINPDEHMRSFPRLLKFGNSAERSYEDFRLTRYGCYLLTINADSSKPIVAAAENYFAVRTRQAELAEEALKKNELVRGGEWERRIVRQLATHTSLVFSVTHGKCFTILSATYQFLLEAELTLRKHELPTMFTDLMDGSIGRRWADYYEKMTGERNTRRHPNIYVEVGNEFQKSNVLLWDNQFYGAFMDWLHDSYFPNHFVDYLQNKTSMKKCNPLSVASAANHVSLDYTGKPANVKDNLRKIIEEHKDPSEKNGYKVITQRMAKGLEN